MKNAKSASLNQFINLAVAEKVAHIEHDEWLARRPKKSLASISRALDILDRPAGQPADEKDKLPKGYVSLRRISTVKP